MKSIGRRALSLYLIIILFLAGCALLFFNLVTNANDWSMNKANKHLYSDGELSTAGDILDTNGNVLVTTENGERVYTDNKKLRMAILHTVGDSSGYIANGVQTKFKDELTGYTLLDGVYNLKRYGKGNDITLTLNSKVCEVALEALGDNKGTVGVMNYKTGEIICVVSTPTYDTYSKPEGIHTDSTGKYEGIYMNRFFSGVYTPGSTFKVLTAICAIENIPDIYQRTFECKGKILVGEGYVICSGTHGKISFEKALNNSCNCAFAQIADELGAEKLMSTAERIGFNTNLSEISGKIHCTKSKIDLNESSSLDIGWAGIGQYTTLINPCHMLTVISAVANGGTAQTPYLVKSITSPSGKNIFTAEKSTLGEYFTADVAQKADELLRSNVKNQYGDSFFPKMNFCGKTGTAEVSDDKSQKPNALFVGYSQLEEMPFAIIVVVEDTSTSISSAVPIASKVMKTVKSEYVK